METDSVQFTREEAILLTEMLPQLEEIPKKPQALVAALQALPRSSGTLIALFDLLVKLHRLSELELDLLRGRKFRFLRTPGRKSFQLVQAGNDHQLP
jgi:hypothetical protein